MGKEIQTVLVVIMQTTQLMKSCACLLNCIETGSE